MWEEGMILKEGWSDPERKTPPNKERKKLFWHIDPQHENANHPCPSPKFQQRYSVTPGVIAVIIDRDVCMQTSMFWYWSMMKEILKI